MIIKIKNFFQKWLWFCLIICAVSTLTTVYIVNKLPKRYSANTVFVLSNIADSGNNINLSFGGFASKGSMESNLIINLLKSRRMAKDTIAKFDLLKVFHTNSMQRAINILSREVKVIHLKNFDKFKVSVIIDDPNLASKIANFYVENLNKLNVELNLTASPTLVKVIDYAETAEYPLGPSVKKSMITAFLFSLLLSLFLALIFEYIRLNFQR